MIQKIDRMELEGDSSSVVVYNKNIWSLGGFYLPQKVEVDTIKSRERYWLRYRFHKDWCSFFFPNNLILNLNFQIRHHWNKITAAMGFTGSTSARLSFFQGFFLVTCLVMRLLSFLMLIISIIIVFGSVLEMINFGTARGHGCSSGLWSLAYTVTCKAFIQPKILWFGGIGANALY